MRKIKRKKVKDRPLTHDQWIEIRHENGKTETLFYPSNADFERERLEMDPQPDLIYRRLNFVNGVPLEYGWTQPPPGVEELGGLLLQRMKVPDWLSVLKHETTIQSKHATPPLNPQPRPEAFGPCPCLECVADAAAALEEEFQRKL